MKNITTIFNILKKFFFIIFFGNISYARKIGVKIGKDCRIYITQWGSEPFLISIGNKVTITSGVKILTHDGSTWLIHDDDGNRFQRYGPVDIGNDVFIGVNSIIMPGVTIGNQVVIGAGSVVTKDIPSNSVAVGNPARVVSSFNDLHIKIKAKCINNLEIANIPNYKERVNKAIELQKLKNAK